VKVICMYDCMLCTVATVWGRIYVQAKSKKKKKRHVQKGSQLSRRHKTQAFP
jgi:hypothetical protein